MKRRFPALHDSIPFLSLLSMNLGENRTLDTFLVLIVVSPGVVMAFLRRRWPDGRVHSIPDSLLLDRIIYWVSRWMDDRFFTLCVFVDSFSTSSIVWFLLATSVLECTEDQTNGWWGESCSNFISLVELGTSDTTTNRSEVSFLQRFVRQCQSNETCLTDRRRASRLFFQVDLSPPLSQMSVSEICDCLKNDIVGLKSTMISIYVQDANEYNLSGQVLATCELDELKQVSPFTRMTSEQSSSFSFRFFQWPLAIGSCSAIGLQWNEKQNGKSKLEILNVTQLMVICRRSRFHPSAQSNSTVNPNGPFSHPLNECQFYTENSVLGAALNQLMSPNGHNASNHSFDEARTTGNEGVSIVSAPKNVKFLIPLGRSGITSNDSTFGLIESSTRTITHVKDIFPFSGAIQSQPATSNAEEPIKSDSEESPLLENETRNQN